MLIGLQRPAESSLDETDRCRGVESAERQPVPSVSTGRWPATTKVVPRMSASVSARWIVVDVVEHHDGADGAERCDQLAPARSSPRRACDRTGRRSRRRRRGRPCRPPAGRPGRRVVEPGPIVPRDCGEGPSCRCPRHRRRRPTGGATVFPAAATSASRPRRSGKSVGRASIGGAIRSIPRARSSKARVSPAASPTLMFSATWVLSLPAASWPVNEPPTWTSTSGLLGSAGPDTLYRPSRPGRGAGAWTVAVRLGLGLGIAAVSGRPATVGAKAGQALPGGHGRKGTRPEKGGHTGSEKARSPGRRCARARSPGRGERPVATRPESGVSSA